MTRPAARSEFRRPGKKVDKRGCEDGQFQLVDRQLRSIRIATAIAAFCGIGLSWRLWTSAHLFPQVPPGGLHQALPYPIDFICLGCLLALLAAIAVFREEGRLMAAFLAVAGLMSVADQMRWQPWFYQYFCMLALLSLHAWKRTDRIGLSVLNSCRLLVVLTYFWSGIQKLNVNFVRVTWSDLTGPLLRFLPHNGRSLPPAIALAVPLLEIGIALGLVTRRWRNVAAVLALATHMVVLALLASSGENDVVWPWNIAMAAFVFILFWRDAGTSPRQLFTGPLSHKMILCLFGILPLCSFADAWDSYLSLALYSGNTRQAVIYVTPAVLQSLPAPVHEYVWQASPPFFLDINRWAYGELNVPVYPESRVYRKVAEEVCRYGGESPDIRLRILGKPAPFTGTRTSEYFDCAHLGEL